MIASSRTRILVDAGLSCRELLKRMAAAGEDPEALTAILITHEHQDHVAGLAVLARRLKIPVFFTEPTHRAWIRMLTPRTTMSYAKWLDHVQAEKEERARIAAGVVQAAAEGAGPSVQASESTFDEGLELSGEADPDFELPVEADESCESSETRAARAAAKADPTFLPAVEYFRAGHQFCIGDIDINPFTIPHDAADPCGFVFHARAESIRMAVATDLGYIPPNVKQALRSVDVLLLESNHDLEMLKDGPYPWSVKQRVLSRVGHLSNHAAAEFLLHDYDGGAHTIVLGHLSESNNLPELAKLSAEQAIGERMTLLGNRIVLAAQHEPLEPICL